jgi:hypothetical protein
VLQYPASVRLFMTRRAHVKTLPTCAPRRPALASGHLSGDRARRNLSRNAVLCAWPQLWRDAAVAADGTLPQGDACPGGGGAHAARAGASAAAAGAAAAPAPAAAVDGSGGGGGGGGGGGVQSTLQARGPRGVGMGESRASSGGEIAHLLADSPSVLTC